MHSISLCVNLLRRIQRFTGNLPQLLKFSIQFCYLQKNAKPQASKNKQQKIEKNVLYSLNYILEPQNKNVYNEKDLIRILTPQ